MEGIVFSNNINIIVNDIMRQKGQMISQQDLIVMLCKYFNVKNNNSIYDDLAEIYNEILSNPTGYEYCSDYMKDVIKRDLISKKYKMLTGANLSEDNIKVSEDFDPLNITKAKYQQMEADTLKDMESESWGSLIKQSYASSLIEELGDFKHILLARDYYNNIEANETKTR